MKISAVIPAYNSAKFLADAVKSINDQTSPIHEIIIIDDGSTDNTEEIAASLPGNIVYFKQPNQGPSAARNKGIEMAKGDWIAFLDADDQWTPDKTALQLDTLTKTPSLKLIAGDMAEINCNDQITVESVLAKHQLLNEFKTFNGTAIPNALAKLVKKNFIPTGTVLVERNTLMEVGLFNPDIRFGEDLELWAKIAAQHSITCLPNILMLRRKHGENATEASEKMLLDLTKVMESLRRQLSPQLQNQGIAANELVATNYWTLGYWYFTSGEIHKAKSAFRISLERHWTLRSSFYYLASLLPPQSIAQLRLIKQKFS